jgi:hypothetical protein
VFKTKKIDGKQLHKAAEALELERAMADSVTEMPVTTLYQTTMQDDKGEDKAKDNILELTKAKVIALLSSKCKGQGDGSAIYAEVLGPVS